MKSFERKKKHIDVKSIQSKENLAHLHLHAAHAQAIWLDDNRQRLSTT